MALDGSASRQCRVSVISFGMGWVWYRLGQVKTNRLVADDGSTDVDVGGMDASEGQFPPPVAPKSPSQRGTDLGRAPLAPAPDRNVQAVEGHAVCGDVDGCGDGDRRVHSAQ